MKTEENLSKKKSDFVAKALEDSVRHYFPQTTYHLTGRIIIQKSYLEELQKEFLRFLLISVVLVFVCIGTLYRSVKISLLLSIHFVIILITFFLILHLCGKKIDILAIMYPPLAFILTASHSIHYINSFIRNRKNEALIQASDVYNKIWKDIGYPSFMAGITTSIGFISFVFTPIVPFKDFGIFSALLSLLSVILTFFLFPLYFSTIRTEFILKDNFFLIVSEKMFTKLLPFLINKKKSIYAATIALTILSGAAATQLQASHTLLEDLSENLKVRKDLDYFEKTFSGIRPLEILVRPRNDSLNNFYDLMLIHVMIKKIYHPGLLVSAGGIAEEWTGNELHFGNLRNQYDDIKDKKKMLEDILRSSQSKMMYHKKDKTFRFSGKLKDENSTFIERKHAWLTYFFHRSGLSDKYELEITGSAELIDANHSTLIQNALQGFFIAMISIMIISLLISRKKRFFLIFLIPNTVPLIFLAGTMRCTGISLKASTAIIFSIGLGMIVDATFYFITKYIQTKKKLHNAGQSLLLSYRLIAPSVILSTIILLSGFSSLIFSNFYSLKIFGILMSVIIFIGFLCDVILVPLLIHTLDVKNESTV
jgi:predicted RND superfamily exporter protein